MIVIPHGRVSFLSIELSSTSITSPAGYDGKDPAEPSFGLTTGQTGADLKISISDNKRSV